jgi:hypothetical protein
MLVLAAAANASSSDNSPGAVYTLTNSAAGMRPDGLELTAIAPSGGIRPISVSVRSNLPGGIPFGFDFDNRGHLLVSNASGSASSYAVGPSGATVISGAVATHQGAPCWLIASKNGRYAYTANAGAGTISGFSVGHDGSLALLDPTGATGTLGPTSHPLDEAVSNNGRYLYNLTDGLHEISAFAIGEDGHLTPTGSVSVPVGAAGLAVR